MRAKLGLMVNVTKLACCQTTSFVCTLLIADATAMILIHCKPNPSGACMQVAAGVYTVAVLLQEAVDLLVGASVPEHSRRVFEAWPQSGLSFCWPTLLRRSAAPFTVHKLPHIVWRRTLSFDAESDVPGGSWSDLADAASALLGNSALDEAAKPPFQQQQQQGQQHWQVSDCPVVQSRQCNKCSLAAGGNWEVFVQEFLGSKTPAATAAELLGWHEQVSQQGGQQGSQQEAEQMGHCQQQNADVSSSVNQCPIKCQVGPRIVTVCVVCIRLAERQMPSDCLMDFNDNMQELA